MQATKNNTKEETIRKFKQLLKHKQEMLERAKQYDGIDIYAKFANAWKNCLYITLTTNHLIELSAQIRVITCLQQTRGINYTISFTEEFPLGGCMSYQFCIHNDNKIHGSYDNKISTTIIAIIEEFFLQNLNVLLYICDTSDNREEVRNRLFIRWFKEYADPQKYTIQSANTTIEGQGFYSSIIVENRNPLLDEIKADFEKSANDLKEK